MAEEEKITENGTVRDVGNELNDIALRCELTDLAYEGCKFTWTNSHTSCRLDKAMMNEVWQLRYEHSHAFFDLSTVSDHSLVRVMIRDGQGSRRIPFRYKEMCSADAYSF